MIKAALTEIQTTPLASLGALAGVLSFVFVLLGPLVTGNHFGTEPLRTSAGIALVTASLVVPATSYFFAFLANLFYLGATFRGTLVACVLYMVSAVFIAAATGVILSGFPVETIPAREGATSAYSSERVLGIDFSAVAFTLWFSNTLVFLSVLGESFFARPKPKLSARHAQQVAMTLEDLWMTIVVVGFFAFLFGSFFSAALAHSVFRAAVGAS